MRLKTAEAIAIRWHMGGFDDAVRGGSFAVSDAYNSYPLAVKLHIADLTATYLMEQGTSAVENGHPKTNDFISHLAGVYHVATPFFSGLLPPSGKTAA